MKKLLLFLVLALMCCGAALAESAATPTPAPTPVPDMLAQPDATRRPITTATPRPADAPLPEDAFIGNAVEIARRVDMLAKSGVYFTYCNITGASQTMWDSAVRGDHTTPVRIFSLDGEALRMALTGGDLESSPWFDLNRPELRRDMVVTLPDVMYVGMDNDVVRLCRMLARYKVFACDIPNDCGLLILQYEDAVPMVLPWYSDRGAVNIAAFPMPVEALEACSCAAEVSAWFAGLGMPEVTFEEVTW